MKYLSIPIKIVALLLICQLCIQSDEIKIFKPQLVLQENDADSNYIMGRPSDIETDEYLNIYLLDSQEKVVRKYDKNGKFISSFGSKGNGPCEFSNPLKLQTINDKIIVIDFSRFHFFSLDGKCLQTKKFVTKNFAASTKYAAEDRLLNITTDFEKKLFILGLWNFDGKQINKIDSFYAPDRIFMDDNYSSFVALIEKYYYDIDSKGAVYYAFSENYEIKKVVGNNIKSFIKESVQPIKISEDERQQFLLQQKEMKKMNPQSKEPIIELKPFLSLIIDIRIDEKDSLWVKTFNTQFKGYVHYSDQGKKIANYSLGEKELKNVWAERIKFGAFLFLTYDNEDGAKIYRANIE